MKKLAEVTSVDVKTSPCLIEATSDMGEFMLFSGLKCCLTVKLSKIANDCVSCQASSGPRGGLNDINLPPMQQGSSIMPGKVNPVIRSFWLLVRHLI
jgi:aspartate ammonia-lyase